MARYSIIVPKKNSTYSTDTLYIKIQKLASNVRKSNIVDNQEQCCLNNIIASCFQRTGSDLSPFRAVHFRVMAKGDGREVGFHDGGCFFKIFKTRTNQQPDVYSIPKLGLGSG